MTRYPLPLALAFGVLFALVAIASVQSAKLTASDPASRGFGWSVAKSGDTVIVGRNGLGLSGAAYVFVREPTGWVEQAKLVSGEVGLDRFGSSVAIDAHTAVVGAQRVGALGTVFVYVRNGTVWSQQAAIEPSSGAARMGFGSSVSISGNRLAAGAVFDNVSTGSAYVYRRWGGVWSEEAKVTASDGSTGDQFGGSVSIDRDRLVVGAHYNDGTAIDGGAAYVFMRSGTTWIEEAKLVGDDVGLFNLFGLSVDIEGDRIVAGAPFQSAPGFLSGSAYVFERAGSRWSQAAKLVYTNGAPLEYLGFSVSLEATTVVAGAHGASGPGLNAGSATVFSRCGTSWLEERLVGDDTETGDELGRSVAVEGGTLLAGAPYDDDTLSSSGSVYVFDLDEHFESYCVASPNSVGGGARISADGCNVVAANDVTLIVTDCAINQPGLFFFGPGQVEVPFGAGFLCVGGPIERLNPPLLTDAAGRVARSVDLLTAPALGLIVPGVTTNFQFWYRDPSGDPSFNLSDALHTSWE